jgi:hypothetical protein
MLAQLMVVGLEIVMGEEMGPQMEMAKEQWLGKMAQELVGRRGRGRGSLLGEEKAVHEAIWLEGQWELQKETKSMGVELVLVLALW